MNVRFTTWLSEAERDALDLVAEENGTSANYVVRVAIRRLLQMKAPELQVTSVTERVQG